MKAVLVAHNPFQIENWGSVRNHVPFSAMEGESFLEYPTTMKIPLNSYSRRPKHPFQPRVEVAHPPIDWEEFGEGEQQSNKNPTREEACRRLADILTRASHRGLAAGFDKLRAKEEPAQREQGAKDYEAVRRLVEAECQNNKWVKKEHAPFVSDYLAHLVAAACGEGHPKGYDFLDYEFPHPNANERPRTQLAKTLSEALPKKAHKIFGLVLWRYHNTQEAAEKLLPILKDFSGDVEKLRESVKAMYGESESKTYLFSTGDARRCTNFQDSWREAALCSLDDWWATSRRAAEILNDPATDATSWHRSFLEDLKFPCFGEYWSKYVYGDIALHVTNKADLTRYTVVGPGCASWLRDVMGLPLQKVQRDGLEALRELTRVVNKVINSGLHKGIEAACRTARLKPLTAYDAQVQCCEAKRGFKLIPMIAAKRRKLDLAAALDAEISRSDNDAACAGTPFRTSSVTPMEEEVLQAQDVLEDGQSLVEQLPAPDGSSAVIEKNCDKVRRER